MMIPPLSCKLLCVVMASVIPGVLRIISPRSIMSSIFDRDACTLMLGGVSQNLGRKGRRAALNHCINIRGISNCVDYLRGSSILVRRR